MRKYYKSDMINLIEYIKNNPNNKDAKEVYKDWFLYENSRLSEDDKTSLSDMTIYSHPLMSDGVKKGELNIFWDGRQSSSLFDLAQTKYYGDIPYVNFTVNGGIHYMRISISGINDLTFQKYDNDKYMEIYKQELSNGGELVFLYGSISREDKRFHKFTLSDVEHIEKYDEYNEYFDWDFSNPYLKLYISDMSFEYKNLIEVLEDKYLLKQTNVISE